MSRWITIGNVHINTEQIASFQWANGRLWVQYAGIESDIWFKDEDKSLYRKLCNVVCLDDNVCVAVMDSKVYVDGKDY